MSLYLAYDYSLKICAWGTQNVRNAVAIGAEKSNSVMSRPITTRAPDPVFTTRVSIHVGVLGVMK